MLRFNFGIAFIALAFASAAVSTSVSSARRALLSETGSNATSLPGLCDTVEQSSGFVQIETERSEDKHYL